MTKTTNTTFNTSEEIAIHVGISKMRELYDWIYEGKSFHFELSVEYNHPLIEGMDNNTRNLVRELHGNILNCLPEPLWVELLENIYCPTATEDRQHIKDSRDDLIVLMRIVKEAMFCHSPLVATCILKTCFRELSDYNVKDGYLLPMLDKDHLFGDMKQKNMDCFALLIDKYDDIKYGSPCRRHTSLVHILINTVRGWEERIKKSRRKCVYGCKCGQKGLVCPNVKTNQYNLQRVLTDLKGFMYIYYEVYHVSYPKNYNRFRQTAMNGNVWELVKDMFPESDQAHDERTEVKKVFDALCGLPENVAEKIAQERADGFSE